jgi:hypothetical protein
VKGKPEPALGLDMPFDEALARFIGTAPAELQSDVRAQKKRRPKPPPEDVDEKDPKAPA